MPEHQATGVLSARQQEASLLSSGCYSCRVSMLAGSEWQRPAGRCWSFTHTGPQSSSVALPEPPCDETLLALPSLELELELELLLLLLLPLPGPFPLGDSAGQQPGLSMTSQTSGTQLSQQNSSQGPLQKPCPTHSAASSFLRPACPPRVLESSICR